MKTEDAYMQTWARGETGFYRLTALDVLLKLNLAVSVHNCFFEKPV
jgi:hypothetical protein